MNRQAVLGIDVGGTGIKCVLMTRSRETVHRERHETGADRGQRAVTSTILKVANGLADHARACGLTPVAAGIAMPGVVDEGNGTVEFAANIGIRDRTPIGKLARERLGLPVRVGHDVRAGGLAEAVLGAGQARNHVLVVIIGTGVGAACVWGGRVNAGAHGAAGEIGHIVVRPGGPICQCGQRGCLETIASANAIARRYTSLSGSPASAQEVARLAAAGNELASRAWAEAIEALADGLIVAHALLDVELIVIGGGLSQAGAQLLAPLRAAVLTRLTFHREPEIDRTHLGDDAGCLGSALLALELVDTT